MLITPRESAIGGQGRPMRLGGRPKSGFNGRMDQDLHRKNGWRENRRALLAAHPVLGFLSPRELEQVTGLMIPRRYRAGEVIFRKGEPGESMMVIASGQVKISMSGLDGKEAVLAILGAGEIIGEMAILDEKPRSADAIALAPSELMLLNRRDFVPFLEREPGLALRLLAMTSDRLRRTSALLAERTLRHLPGRLAKALLELGKCDEGHCPPGARVELPISQKTFASLLGTSRETLNKQLHAWQSEGLIALEPGAVVIFQPEALLRFAEE
jgi:CRP/FNR family transcriptional regulator, cyclic AMP receptor protein